MDLTSLEPETIKYLLIAVYAIVCGAYCGAIAGAKSLDKGGWFYGGMFFGIIALIAVAGMPVAPKKS